MRNCQKINPSKHRGVVTVEFTMIATLLFFAIFAIIGIARVVYIYNAAVNATREGARLAVVCDSTEASSDSIKAKMVAKVPGLTASNIDITYNLIPGCTAIDCVNSVTVVTDFTVAIATPASFPLGEITMPDFSTTLTRESMNSTNNSVCS